MYRSLMLHRVTPLPKFDLFPAQRSWSPKNGETEYETGRVPHEPLTEPGQLYVSLLGWIPEIGHH